MTGLAFLIFLFDTLLGTLIFVAIAGLIKAWAEREETMVVEEAAPAERVTPASAQSEA